MNSRETKINYLREISKKNPLQIVRDILTTPTRREKFKFFAGKLVAYELQEYHGYRIPLNVLGYGSKSDGEAVDRSETETNL